MTPDQITELLDDLATKYGPAAQQLYELAVRQATIQGLINLVAGVALLLVIVVGYAVWARWYWRTEKAQEAKSSYHTADGFGLFFGALLAALPGFLAVYMTYNGLLWVANPQWQAFQVLKTLLP